MYVELRPELQGDSGTPYKDDATHLNDAGNVVFARNIFEAVMGVSYASENIIHPADSNNLYPRGYTTTVMAIKYMHLKQLQVA